MLKNERPDVTVVELTRPEDKAPYIGVFDETVATLERLESLCKSSFTGSEEYSGIIKGENSRNLWKSQCEG